VGICFFKNNSRVWVFENKKFKELLESSFLFSGDLKNWLGPDLRNPKRGGYEVGAGVRVCD
jgi:hypothetical protein